MRERAIAASADNRSPGSIALYRQEDGSPSIEVRLEKDTVWLSQQQLAELFQVARTTVVEHIQHIYDEGELSEASTCRKFR
jgi:hypothetical protein